MENPNWATTANTEAGTKVRADGGFTCIKEGAELTVMRDRGGLYVPCKEGKHYLDGQLRDGKYVGLYFVGSGERGQEENMNGLTGDQVSAVEKALIDQGKIIEAGWIGLRAMAIPADAPAVQIDEMRSAFFAGAAHLYSTILRVLDPGEEPTDADLKRLTSVDDELKAFADDFAARHIPTEGNA